MRPRDERAPRPRREPGSRGTMDDARVLDRRPAGEPNGPTLLLSRRDLARELRVSVREVDRLRARGALPAPLRFGRSPRWRRADVARWLAGLRDAGGRS